MFLNSIFFREIKFENLSKLKLFIKSCRKLSEFLKLKIIKIIIYIKIKKFKKIIIN